MSHPTAYPTAEASVGAQRNATRGASTVDISALFSKAGSAEDVAELLKKGAKKHSKWRAALQVQGAAGEKATEALSENIGLAAETAIKRGAALTAQESKMMEEAKLPEAVRK